MFGKKLFSLCFQESVEDRGKSSLNAITTLIELKLKRGPNFTRLSITIVAAIMQSNMNLEQVNIYINEN